MRSAVCGAGLVVFVALLVIVFGGVPPARSQALVRNGPVFTEGQARRGQAVFDRACAGCHTVEGSGTPPMELAGQAFLERWHSVNDLFGKLSMTMPANAVLSLKPPDTLSVTAYILSKNGFASGPKPLSQDRVLMQSMLLRAADHVPDGQAYFAAACALCHVTDRSQPYMFTVSEGGFTLGSQRWKVNLATPDMAQKWPTPRALSDRIVHTMPAYDAEGLDAATYAAITAYLSGLNGLPRDTAQRPPAASTGVPVQTPTVPDETLEPGFVSLFNGRDFDQFGFLLGGGCTPPPGGCGHAGPATTFTVKNGVIVDSGRPAGYMYTRKTYLTFTLRFDYRFLPWKNLPSSEQFWGNSGVMLFIADHKVWPKSIEIQGMERYALIPFPLDTKMDYSADPQALERARRPIGEWNTVEIVSQNGQIRSSLNGIPISVVLHHEFKAPGHIGFQSEGAPILFRNIRIREEN